MAHERTCFSMMQHITAYIVKISSDTDDINAGIYERLASLAIAIMFIKGYHAKTDSFSLLCFIALL